MRPFSCFPFLLAALVATPGWCADYSLNVTATIGATCSFTEVPVHMGFPEIDPSGSDTYTTSVTVRVRCTHGTTLKPSIDGATQSPVIRQLAGQGFVSHVPDTLPYSLAWSTGPEATGGFSASAQDFRITLTGTLTPAQYQDAAAGHFTDSLTLQLNP